jgi:peptidoglycan-N-acetylmuramic acid deacetylase
MQIINQYNGVYLDKQHSDGCDDKVVYLTFDAGYENGNVEKILDVLNREQVTGAFFILGNLIKRNPELVLRMADEGHLVCNHTFHHKNITTLTDTELYDEISSLEAAYQELTGKEMSKYFRPPEGVFDAKSLQYLNEHGYKTVFWSFAYADWDNHKQMNPDHAKKKIMDHIHNGEVMLLHPTSATNAQILGAVIQEIKSLGYRFGSLDELEG